MLDGFYCVSALVLDLSMWCYPLKCFQSFVVSQVEGGGGGGRRERERERESGKAQSEDPVIHGII